MVISKVNAKIEEYSSSLNCCLSKISLLWNDKHCPMSERPCRIVLVNSYFALALAWKLSTEDQPWMVFGFSPVLAGVARLNLYADWPLNQFFAKDLQLFWMSRNHTSGHSCSVLCREHDASIV